MEEVFVTESPEETRELAKKFAKKIEKNDFVAFFGDLGAGKTAFISALCSVIAPGESVCSPTYAIVNEYKGLICPIYHFDMYRITDELDLESTGFYDYLNHGIILTEWSENIVDVLPESRYEIHIKKLDNGTKREITVKNYKTEVQKCIF